MERRNADRAGPRFHHRTGKLDRQRSRFVIVPKLHRSRRNGAAFCPRLSFTATNVGAPRLSILDEADRGELSPRHQPQNPRNRASKLPNPALSRVGGGEVDAMGGHGGDAPGDRRDRNQREPRANGTRNDRPTSGPHAGRAAENPSKTANRAGWLVRVWNGWGFGGPACPAFGSRGRTRTDTSKGHRILNPARLPIPPLGRGEATYSRVRPACSRVRLEWDLPLG
jgi:hypothetical protein